MPRDAVSRTANVERTGRHVVTELCLWHWLPKYFVVISLDFLGFTYLIYKLKHIQTIFRVQAKYLRIVVTRVPRL